MFASILPGRGGWALPFNDSDDASRQLAIQESVLVEALCHQPSSFLSDIQTVAELDRRDLGGYRVQVNSLKPFTHWQMRALHRRPVGRMKLLTATLVKALPIMRSGFPWGCVSDTVTIWADGSLRPLSGFKKFPARVIIGKAAEIERESWHRITGVHISTKVNSVLV